MFRFGTGFGLLNCPLSECNSCCNNDPNTECVSRAYYDENLQRIVHIQMTPRKKKLNRLSLMKRKFLDSSWDL